MGRAASHPVRRALIRDERFVVLLVPTLGCTGFGVLPHTSFTGIRRLRPPQAFHRQ